MANDVFELRLPPKSQYVSILRATVGVIAGNMSFNYDEIIQIRTAVSEAFDLAIRYVAGRVPAAEVNELSFQFAMEDEKLEIMIPSPLDSLHPVLNEENEESQALLDSLVDELEFGSGAAGKPLIRMVKHMSTGRVQ